MNRRSFLAYATTVALVAGTLPRLTSAAAARVDVYKGPECDCCGDWLVYLRNNGFNVVVHQLSDVAPFRASQGITPALASCHTAVVDGYVIEGHVPAADIRRLLAERPERARGLTVPGMKHGSPGMETPFIKPQAYAVLLILKDGSTRVWRQYPGA
jgi:hypothetical protein